MKLKTQVYHIYKSFELYMTSLKLKNLRIFASLELKYIVDIKWVHGPSMDNPTNHGPIWLWSHLDMVLASTKNVQQKTEAHSDTPKPAQPAHLTSLRIANLELSCGHNAGVRTRIDSETLTSIYCSRFICRMLPSLKPARRRSRTGKSHHCEPPSQ